MANCKQCSIDLWGKDCGDLKGVAPLDSSRGWPVVCEGCGPILVNSEGECLTNCVFHHGMKEKGPPYNMSDPQLEPKP